MKSLLLSSEEKGLLKEVLSFSSKRKARLYIVGGYLRDILLKRKKDNPDIDFCLKNGAIKFSSLLAKKTKCGFVVLDKEHGSARMVKKINGKFYTLDFTDFRGKNLEEDLLFRDFTINSMAVELKTFLNNGLSELIDLYSAKADLKQKVIRRTYKRAFDEDAVRILRTFSFACQLGFKIEKDTLKDASLKRNKLKGESYERIRDELFKILVSPCAYETLVQMDKLKILTVILPEIEIMRGVNQGPYHHLDVFKHSLESVRQAEIVVRELRNNQDVQNYLSESIAGGRSRLALMKLAVFLHDIGKPQARRREKGRTLFHGHERIGRDISEAIALRLKLSNDEIVALKKMVFWHLRPGYLADNPVISARAKFRYFRDTGKEGVSTLVLSLADQRSTKGPLTTEESRIQHERSCLKLIKEYFKKEKEPRAAPLVDGYDIMNRFKLAPGPFIGEILSRLQELQATGRIKIKEDAFKAVKKFITTHKKPKTK